MARAHVAPELSTLSSIPRVKNRCYQRYQNASTTWRREEFVFFQEKEVGRH